MSQIIKITALLLLFVSSVAAASYPQVGIGAKVSRYMFGGSIGNDTLAMWGWGVETEFLVALSRCFSLRTDVVEFRTNDNSGNSFHFNSQLTTDVIGRFPLNGRFIPYLYGGIGYATPKITPEFDFRFGIGVQYAFAQKWKVFVEDEMLRFLGKSSEKDDIKMFSFVGGGLLAKLSAGVRFGG